jgi:alanine racemase
VPENGVQAQHAGGRLTIDLGALAANYRKLARLAGSAQTGAVVKADAYGIGLAEAVPALFQAGCRDFFAAFGHEALAVRQLAPGARIFVLTPVLGAGGAEALAKAQIIPVINTVEDWRQWHHTVAGCAEGAFALHVDTGMNRLGLTIEEAGRLAADGVRPMLLMSHLACADEPASPFNHRQLAAFREAAQLFAGVTKSLANSAGIFLGPEFHGDLTRPGIALYGASPVPAAKGYLNPVVVAEARVVQVRAARAGESVSYGATARLRRDSLLAVAAVGYGDGYPRAASGTGVPLRDAVRPAGCGFIAGRLVPVIGRVTMDTTIFDVTDCGEGKVAAGDWIELFGPNLAIESAAEAAGTIAYELLTGLGRRYHRRHLRTAPPDRVTA